MLTFKLEQEEDGRWIAEVTALPGTIVYGATPQKARTRTALLALRVIAARMDNGEPVLAEAQDLFAPAWPTGLALYIQSDMKPSMKPIAFVGSALEDLRDFPANARREAG